jgi:hypothetical protein
VEVFVTSSVKIGRKVDFILVANGRGESTDGSREGAEEEPEFKLLWEEDKARSAEDLVLSKPTVFETLLAAVRAM